MDALITNYDDAMRSLSGKVANGDNADITEFPHQAALMSTTSRWVFCGASILNAGFLLTAAHCVDGE